MKTLFMTKIAVPVTAAVLGVAGAFNTNAASNEAKDTLVPGFKHMSSATACDISRDCQDQGSIFCTDNGLRVWGKATGVPGCAVDLFEP